MTGPCPNNLISAFFDGETSSEKQTALENHIAECESCRHALEEDCGDQRFWHDLSTATDDAFDSDWKTGGNIETEPDGISTAKETARQGGLNPSKSKILRVLDTLKPLLGASDDPASAGRIANYEIIGIIGSGGMGIVLKAREPALDRVVAIKVLLPHLATDEACRFRFQREAKAAAAIKHAGIIPIYRVDVFQDLPYFVMPFEIGPSLQERIELDGPLSVTESLRVAAQIADALAAAHQSGLVHRDIKPSNILLAPGTERALLADFGLAQTENDHSLTQTGMLAGTPPFMSPEQARGEVVDHRSDLFSLGSVLFSMLTGRPPVLEKNTYKLVRLIGDEAMPSLDDSEGSFPAWLQNLVGQLHCHDPQKRIQSAAECSHLINQCLRYQQDPIENSLPSRLASIQESRTETFRKLPAWFWIATSVCTLVVGVCFIAFAIDWLRERSNSQSSPINQTQFDDSSGPRAIEPPSFGAKEGGAPDVGVNAAATDKTDIYSWDDSLDETVLELRERLAEFDE